MAQILGVIDKSDKMKIRPPKAPKNFKMKIEDNLMMNIENINIHNSRSRQLRNLDKKSSTIEQAISKTPNLEFKKDLLKRKSSFANIKRDVGGKITTKVKNKTQSFKGFKSLYNTADREFMTNDSNSELYNLTKDVSKKSLLESFNKDKPEIEFVSNKSKYSLIKDSESFSMSKSKITQNKDSKSPGDKLSKLNPWKSNGDKYDEDLYCKNLDTYAKNLIQKMKSGNNTRKTSKTKRGKGSKEKIKTLSRNGSATNTILEMPRKSILKKPKISKSPIQNLMASIDTRGDNNDIKHDEELRESPIPQ